MTLTRLSGELEPVLTDVELRQHITTANAQIQTLQQQLITTTNTANEALAGLNAFVHQAMGKDAIGIDSQYHLGPSYTYLSSRYNPATGRNDLIALAQSQNWDTDALEEYVNTKERYGVRVHPEALMNGQDWRNLYLPTSVTDTAYRGVDVRTNLLQVEQLPRMWSTQGLRVWLDSYMKYWFDLTGGLKQVAQDAPKNPWLPED